MRNNSERWIIPRVSQKKKNDRYSFYFAKRTPDPLPPPPAYDFYACENVENDNQPQRKYNYKLHETIIDLKWYSLTINIFSPTSNYSEKSVNMGK